MYIDIVYISSAARELYKKQLCLSINRLQTITEGLTDNCVDLLSVIVNKKIDYN